MANQLSGNKGEWSEAYVALRLLGDGKLYIADANGLKNPNEWMTLLELIRHETAQRIVTYRYDAEATSVDIYVDGDVHITVPASAFLTTADLLSEEIKQSRGTYKGTAYINEFFEKIET